MIVLPVVMGHPSLVTMFVRDRNNFIGGVLIGQHFTVNSRY